MDEILNIEQNFGLEGTYSFMWIYLDAEMFKILI